MWWSFIIYTNMEPLCHTPETNCMSILPQLKKKKRYYHHMWHRLLFAYQNPCFSLFPSIHLDCIIHPLSCSHTLSCYWVLGNRKWVELMYALYLLRNFCWLFPPCISLHAYTPPLITWDGNVQGALEFICWGWQSHFWPWLSGGEY